MRVLIAGLCCLTSTLGIAQDKATASLPNVVLVGDSIRLSYATFVEKSLAGKSTVISAKANGGDSSNVLRNLDAWVIEHRPAIVHFNCGIHDTKKFKASGEFQVSPDQYEANLRSIVERIRAKTDAVVVFAMTSPILDDRAAKVRSDRDYELLGASVEQYNAIAKRVMRELNVPVNDLHAALAKNEKPIGVLIGSDGVHLTETGRSLAGKQVAQFIRRHLAADANSVTTAPLQSVDCEGTYRHHLQGICTDDKGDIFWSFTTTLVKTDPEGKVLRQIEVGNHHGDLCHHDGRIYVAVNFGRFNDPQGKADSWVYVYKASDLSLVSKHEVQRVFHGAGGIGFRAGRFFVVGGLPNGIRENYVYEYDSSFRFIKKHVVKSGHTLLGIQTAAFAHDRWWFGCYGDPKTLLVTDADFELQGRYEFDCSLGIVGLKDGQLLGARGGCTKDAGCTGSARVLLPDERAGLRVPDKSQSGEKSQSDSADRTSRPGIDRIWLGHRSHDPGKLVVNRMSKEPGESIVRFGRTANSGQEVRVGGNTMIHPVETPLEESDGIYQ